MADLSVHFSTGNDVRQTPPEVFDPLHAEFDFVVDLAALDTTKRLDPYLGPDQPLEEYQDALTAPWAEWFGEGPGWCNPPYSRGLQGLFIAKAARERRKGFTTVMLLPARPDTTAFHAYIYDKRAERWRDGIEVRFLQGRIQFLDETGGPVKCLNKKKTREMGHEVWEAAKAPFPSMIVIFRA